MIMSFDRANLLLSYALKYLYCRVGIYIELVLISLMIFPFFNVW